MSLTLTQIEALLGALPAAEAARCGEAVVRRVVADSRQVQPGDLYAAIPGAKADGRDYAAEAVRRGAAALLVQRDLPLPVAQLQVRRVRAVLGPVAAAVMGDPGARLPLVGITGTNGKTTTTLLLVAALSAAGTPSAAIGTLGAQLSGAGVTLRRPSLLTTPEAPQLHELLRWAVDEGARAGVLEASSIALDQGRLDGLRFTLAVHLGLEAEHLDFHGTIEQYYASKALLFAPARTEAAVVRVDDEWGVRLAAQAQVPLVTFGYSPAADVRLGGVRSGLSGTQVSLSGRDGLLRLEIPLLGRVNAVNAAAAYLAARHLGLSRQQAAEGLAAVEQPEGRHRLVLGDGSPLVVVDYAHTPGALHELIATARGLACPGGRVVLVFGGRGERARAKRADLGRVAGEADLVVLTSDSCEVEDLGAVLDEYRLGLMSTATPVLVEHDRREATALALARCRQGDVVLVAGRGHETRLTVDGTTHVFDDRVVAQELLAERASRRGGAPVLQRTG